MIFDSELGPRQSFTAEGFLLCRDVGLARVGQQLYAGHELPELETDADGWVVVERPEAEVFSPTSMRSFLGKPITIEHPNDEVHPGNWREHAVGHVARVWRDGNVLRGDLLVTDARAIDLIRRGGWRSLSCGYNARYVQDAPGEATQHDIVGNHLALLRTGEARCGTVCSVGDARPVMTIDSARRILREPERPMTGPGFARRVRAGEVVADHIAADPAPLRAWKAHALGQARSIVHMSDAELHDAGRTLRRLMDRAAASRAAASTPQAIARAADARRQEQQRGIAQRVREFWESRNG